MRLKVPKTERRKSKDTKGRRIIKAVVVLTAVIVVVGLVGLHLGGVIFGNDSLLAGDELVSRVITPAQNGFSSVVDWVVDRLYQLKLYSRLELEYNNLRQENEQLVYRAMLADELQYKLSVYENLYDEVRYQVRNLEREMFQVLDRAVHRYGLSYTECHFPKLDGSAKK